MGDLPNDQRKYKSQDKEAKSYGERFSWDKQGFTTHCVNCLSSCTYRAYVKDGAVTFQEQAGTYPISDEMVPDRNPMGCQKGAAFHKQLTSKDRLIHPMRRVGERGSGSFEQISWDEAIDEIAAKIVETIESSGPECVIVDESAEGGMVSIAAHLRFASVVGATSLDGIASVNDFPAGHYITFGAITGGATADDSFFADTIVIWHANPAYSRIAYYHYLTEARYRGAKIVHIGPDYSPSAIHTDIHLPINPGTDAALALGVARYIVQEDLFDEEFIKTQTDLSLLVRKDTLRLLRPMDIDGVKDDYSFYHFGVDGEIHSAPKDTLKLDYDPYLRGTFKVKDFNGEELAVTTVFELLVEELSKYDFESVASICGVTKSSIVTLAELFVSKKAKILEGFDTAKHFHGDLMERSMNLILALTGNWGKKGSGLDTYIVFPFDGTFIEELKLQAGVEETEQVVSMMEMLFGKNETGKVPQGLPRPGIWDFMAMSALGATTTPPAYFWKDHCGFDDIWKNSMIDEDSRTSGLVSLSDYLEKARPDWEPYIRPGKSLTPKVLIEPGTNALRRTRGGGRTLLKNLWPKLELIVSIDQRLNSAGMQADIVLPALYDTERVNMQYPITHSKEVAFSDKLVSGPIDAKSDWEIFGLLADAVSKIATDKGLGETEIGRQQPHKLSDTGNYFHRWNRQKNEEAYIDEMVRDAAYSGLIDSDTTIETLRAKGFVDVKGNGVFPHGRILGSELEQNKTFSAYRWHVESFMPYPTTTGRATFYVDHEWFINAHEALPTHKEPPRLGGNYPFVLTGGHPRWSIHACNSTNPMMLETTRGHPTLLINLKDAVTLGIKDDGMVKVKNDFGSFEVRTRLSADPRSGQVILYSAWEPYGFNGWNDGTLVEPGIMKFLHLVHGWGHLRFMPMQWQPAQFDRMTRVELIPM